MYYYRILNDVVLDRYSFKYSKREVDLGSRLIQRYYKASNVNPKLKES